MPRGKRQAPPHLPEPPEGLISPEAMRELRVLDEDPLSTGFTRRKNREILETALWYSQLFEQFAQVWEKALKYDKLRKQNTAAQRKWRKAKESSNGKG